MAPVLKMLGPSQLAVSCTYTSGILFYSEFGGFWTGAEKWPTDIAATASYRVPGIVPSWSIVVCDDTPLSVFPCNDKQPTYNPHLNSQWNTPPIQNGNSGRQGMWSVVYLRDFLAVAGCTNGIYVRTNSNMSQDDASRALITNYALIMKYRRAGPYEETFMLTVPPDMVSRIDKSVSEAISKYCPEEQCNQLGDLLAAAQFYVIDMRRFPSYQWNANKLKMQQICRSYERRIFKDFALPIAMPDPDPNVDVNVDKTQNRELTFAVLARIRDGVHRMDIEDDLSITKRALDAIFDKLAEGASVNANP